MNPHSNKSHLDIPGSLITPTVSPMSTSARPMIAAHSRKRSGSVADEQLPTTPRISARFSDQPAQEIPPEDSSSSTPTRRDFGGIPGQRPLPEEPFTPSQTGDKDAVTREDSRRSVYSHRSSDSQDIEMGDDDDDRHDGSDNDSATSEKPSRKKKKGQRFYCTDFPPCQLSFTRSEHLARHIRKHTGERPFECHCSRRFSRLDNLRQHAQTVHVNEEIPGDSLAATGTRFQRQIRTDRVRPPNVRPRASTASSHGGHGAHNRGHSRNLSASSITSTASSIGLPEDPRPRPAPLNINQDATARARLSVDTFNPAIGNVGTQFGYYQQSPSGFSSPTSATFSTGASSPRFPSGMQSPPLSISRSSFYNGSRTPARRLSVPSGANPLQTSPGQTTNYPPLFFPPLPSSSAATQYSNTTSIVPSPTSSVFSHHRRESDVELDLRRRTWHPGTHSSYSSRPATSGLTYHQTPDDAVPALAPQPAASQITRLPGIESFDHAPPPPTVPTRNVTSPTQRDPAGRPPNYPGPAEGSASASDEHRVLPGWETGLHHNLTRLEIAKPPPRDGHGWMEQRRSIVVERPTTAPHMGFPQQMAHGYAPVPQSAVDARAATGSSTDERASKRQAWYGSPAAPLQRSQPIMIAHRTSPESSSSEGVPTPSTSQGRELHPAILHANGMVEMPPPSIMLTEDQQKAAHAQYHNKPGPTRADSGFHSYAHLPGQAPAVYMMQTGRDMHAHPEWRQAAATRTNNDMGRLEALVAVATSENRAVEHQS